MPATETTPGQWAEDLIAECFDECFVENMTERMTARRAELAALRARADQADRMREAILPLVDFLRGFAADHEGDARDYFPALEAALADNPPAR